MNETKNYDNYILPSTELLYKGKEYDYLASEAMQTLIKLDKVFKSFKIDASCMYYIIGHLVTTYIIDLRPETTIQSIRNKSKDIALEMKTAAIRVIPIPKDMAVGIEIPNNKAQCVNLRDVIDSEDFKNSQSLLTWAVGAKTDANAYITSLDTMPHLLISGRDNIEIRKCIDNIILSILYKAKPNEVKFMLIDTKKEMSVYKNMTHLSELSCMEPKTSADVFSSLNKLVDIMEARYEKYANSMVRNIKEYNEKMIKENKDIDCYIVGVINDLADLRLFILKDIENLILKLAQKGRAVGIHLVLATQNPDENVITENIKCNFPARLSFKVKSVEESNIILNCEDAEKLVGSGDMLFLHPSEPRPIRLQCAFVSSIEVEKVVTFITKNILLISQYDKLFEDEKLMEIFTDKISNKLIEVISEKTDKKFEEYHKAIENTNNTINFSKQVSKKLFDNYNLIKKEKGEKILKELIETVSNIAVDGMFFLKKIRELNTDLTNIDTTNIDKLDLVFILDDIRKEMEKVDSLNNVNNYEKLKQIDKEIDDLIKKQ